MNRSSKGTKLKIKDGRWVSPLMDNTSSLVIKAGVSQKTLDVLDRAVGQSSGQTLP